MEKLEEIFNRNELGIPRQIMDGLWQYASQRIRTGDFLRCVLEGDLFGAVGRAHPESLRHLKDIVNFVRWNLPACSFGSPYTVSQWLKEGKDDDPGPDQETSGEAGCDEPPPGPEVAKQGDHPQVDRTSDLDRWIGEDPGDIGRFAERIGSGSTRPEVGEAILDALTGLWEQWEEGKRLMNSNRFANMTQEVADKMEELVKTIGQMFYVSRQFLDKKGPFA